MVQKEFIDVLKLLVKIESISSEKKHYKDVEQSAEGVKDLFEGLGLTSKISKSNEGMPAVLAQTEQDPNADPAQGDTVGKIRAETDSTKLKQFLNNLDPE